MHAYSKKYLDDEAENQDKLFEFVAESYPDKDTEESRHIWQAKQEKL